MPCWRVNYDDLSLSKRGPFDKSGCFLCEGWPGDRTNKMIIGHWIEFNINYLAASLKVIAGCIYDCFCLLYN